MGLYLENGYIDFEWVYNRKTPFVWVYGGRGTGKTYGALKFFTERNIKFIYLRRTQTQIDTVCIPEFSPFKAIDNDTGVFHAAKKLSKHTVGFYIADDEGKPSGNPVCVGVALSTIAAIRGFDASDYDCILYDEFIPELHERKIAHEDSALFNAYETINRNRELSGRPPLKMIGLANTNTINNSVFTGFELVSVAEKMKAQGREIGQKEKHTLIDTFNSPISKEKENTALYKSVSGAFRDMAISSKFSTISGSRIEPKRIAEYIPVVTVGEITVYRHKSRDELYISSHESGSPPRFGAQEVELRRFCKSYRWIISAYLHDKIIFESQICEILLTTYAGMC